MATRRSRPLPRILAVVFVASLTVIGAASTAGQRSAITAPRNLAEMVDEADLIIRGHVTSTRVEPHPQFPALWTAVVTLQVDETLKGQPSESYTFRQFIWDSQDRVDAAGYQKGGQLLLLLLKPNVQGLSSPAGLEQGRFQLQPDSSGKLFATNGRNNVGLFNGVTQQARIKGARLAPRAIALASEPPKGPVALEDLRDLIRQLAGTN
jgi:hypothetical protein